MYGNLLKVSEIVWNVFSTPSKGFWSVSHESSVMTCSTVCLSLRLDRATKQSPAVNSHLSPYSCLLPVLHCLLHCMHQAGHMCQWHKPFGIPQTLVWCMHSFYGRALWHVLWKCTILWATGGSRMRGNGSGFSRCRVARNVVCASSTRKTHTQHSTVWVYCECRVCIAAKKDTRTQSLIVCVCA